MFPYSRKSAQNYEIIPIFATAHTNFLEMNRLIFTVFVIFLSYYSASAQEALNLIPESIVGEYEILHQGEYARVKVSMEQDSTFMAQIFWIDDMYDKHGRVRLDEKNPDKALRSVPCNKIILMKGLKYDKEKQRWGDTKLYDPTRGVSSNVVFEFKEDKGLRARMSFLCFSQTSYWRKLN